jgi:hypothetical protein
MGGLGLPDAEGEELQGHGQAPPDVLQPHRAALIVVITAGAIRTIFQVLGPKILALRRRRFSKGSSPRPPAIPARESISTTSAAFCCG